MLDRVTAAVSRYRMFEPGQSVGVAVSGGADSVALLYLLAEMAPSWHLALTVLHLNHRLRGRDSDEDERFVAALAGLLGLPTVIGHARLGKGNLEQEGRRARRAFFLAAMRDRGLDRVALGHTRSDQAETVLFRLLRGAGPSGLAGILPKTREGFVRPLITVDRDEVRAWLGVRRIPWREDASNADRRFARNRIRHDLLPVLEREWNPRLISTLAHLAEISLREEQYWEARIARLGALVVRPSEVLVNLDKARHAHPALLGRLLRKAARGIDFAHLDRLAALAASSRGTGRLRLPGGIEACRSFGWLRIGPSPAAGEPSCPLQVPGETRWAGRRLRTAFVRAGDKCGYNEAGTQLDWDKLSRPLELRGWRPGDAFVPDGGARLRKLHSLFQEEKVPLWERRGWPILTAGGSICWVYRFGRAAGLAPAAGARRVLQIAEVDDLEEE